MTNTLAYLAQLVGDEKKKFFFFKIDTCSEFQHQSCCCRCCDLREIFSPAVSPEVNVENFFINENNLAYLSVASVM